MAPAAAVSSRSRTAVEKRVRRLQTHLRPHDGRDRRSEARFVLVGLRLPRNAEQRRRSAAVWRDVPSFDGTAPPTQGAPELIIASLQKLLADCGLAGTAGLLPQTDVKGESLRYLFSVKDPAPKICTRAFNGVSAERLPELTGATHALSGIEYSRYYVTRMAQGTLLDIIGTATVHMLAGCRLRHAGTLRAVSPVGATGVGAEALAGRDCGARQSRGTQAGRGACGH